MRSASTVTLILSGALAFMCTGALAATVYKWVDEKGVTHYSDQPHPAAQKMEVKGAQGYQNTATAPSSPAAQNEPQSAPGSPYTLCELGGPENDEVFMNTDTVPARIRLQPALRANDRVQLTVDGQRLSERGVSSTDFTLSPVTRGTHTIVARVLDEAGQTLCTTSSRTFHVRIQNKIHPGDAADKDLYDLEPEEAKHIPTVCHSLDMALEYLDKDREFLTRGGVFTNDVIDAYIGLKMQEITKFRMSTHPVEIEMYYSC